MKKTTKLLLLLPLLLIFTKNISAQVTANFTTNNPAGCPNPFLAIVNDASTSVGGTIVSWSWQLTGPAGFTPVNSVNSQIAAPLSIPGLYNVTLTACDNLGFCDTRTINGFIEVFNRPTINYTITPTVGCPPLQVCFDGTIDPGCGTVQSTVFDLRDGNIVSNQTDFCHTYQNSGTYSNFVVSATNSCGCVTTTTINQSVSATAAPVANFTATQTFSCTAPLTTTISSTSSAPAGSTLTWIIPGFPNGSGNSVTRTFANPGTFDVTLIIVAPNGCSDTLTRTNYITVGQQNADFTSNITNVCAGNSISFQNLSSGTPSGFQWSFPGGTPATSTQQNPVVIYNTVGNYNVSLIVSYAGGCSDTIISNNYISVNTPPVSSYDVSQTSSCNTPFITTFTSTSTNSAQTSWQFPGGIPATFTGNGPVNVTYINPGTFSITMIDSAANGCVTSRVFNNVISITPLTVSISADTINGCIPLTTNFNFTLNLPETVSSASWSLPGSNLGSSNDLNPNAIYNSTGCYEATLTVNTLNGCIATVTRPNIVCAGSPPTSTFTYTPPSICFEDEEVCFNYTGSGADTILWIFGDPSPPVFGDELAQVCHPYSSELGVFTVTMIPYQYGCPGDSAILLNAVEVLGPIAIATDSFSCINQNRRFFRSNSLEADSVFWIFGDTLAGGTDTSSLTNPIWEYDSTGIYTVTLIAFNDSTGCSHETNLTVRVFSPEADFSSNLTSICLGSNVVFTNTSQFRTSANNNIRWDWDLSNGLSFPNLFDTRGNNRNRQFNNIGVFSISMRNMDPNGCMDTITKLNYLNVHGILGGFTATTPRSGCAPLTVSFLDTSIAPLTGIASWSWNFGDPSTTSDTSNLPNPTYTYTNDGFYNVTLTVTDSFGCVRTYNYANYINAIRPNSSFTLDRNFICNNQSVNITNNSTGNGLVYDWQFTNASPSSSNLQSPGLVTFNQEGLQIISLEVTDSIGCSHISTDTVSVFDVIANGLASPDFSSCFNPPQLVNFTNLSLNNVDTTSALWDFGNGLTSTNYNASTIYNIAGVYPVTLTISSLSGCTSTQIVDTVFIGGPYGNINLLSTSNVGCPCTDITFEITTLNALAPTLLPGDGNAVSLSPMVVPGDTVRDTITYSYCQIGQFSPLLFIQDGTCSGNINSQDTIYIDSLVIDFDFSVAGLCDSGQVCFTNQSFSELLGVSDITSVFWDFGDGNTSTDFSPCNFYTSAGSYDVELTIENSKGCFKTLVQNVYIPESPIAQFGQSSVNGCANVAVMFYDSTTFDSLANITSWLWDFGGGNTSDLQNPEFTFTNIGIETVTLTVTDNFGCTSQTSSIVEVFPLPAVVASNDTIICEGSFAQLNVSGAIDYVWSPDYFIDDLNSNSPLVSPFMDTVYFVTGTDINGCSNVDSVSVSVNSLQVNFAFNSACESDTVFFNDLSLATGGLLASWNWNFGDGGTSNLQNPFHSYNVAGVYDVNLEVTDDLGCISDTTIQIIINESPVALFVADSVCIGLTTSFNSSSSSPGDGNIIAWSWDFGDSSGTSDLQNPVYTYSSPGVYNVCLTITTDLSCESNNNTICSDIVVFDLPSVTVTNNSTICLGDDLQLIATGGNDYLWSPDYFVSDINVSNPLVSPQVDTTYFVSITDLNGCSISDSVVIQVNSLNADFTADNSCAGDTTNFTDLSTASGGTITSWSWDFDDGNLSSNQNPLNVYTSPGNYDVSLTVTDDFGCTDIITQVVNISTPPVAQFVADSVCIGLPTSFNSSTSDSGAGNIISYEWDFGVAGGNSNAANPTFTYAAPGIYNVCLTITTDALCEGNSSSVCNQVVVYALPTANFASDTACFGSGNSFLNNSQSSSGNIVQSFWNFGQNPGDTLSQIGVSNSSFTYDNTGNYIVNLTVTDEFGCTANTTRTAFVFENPIADFTFTTACIGQPNEFVSFSVPGANNPVAQYLWNFDEGAGFISGDSVQLYSFQNSGPHNISHVVVDAFGCSDTLVTPLNIIAGPQAVITASETTVCSGNSINFSAANSLVQVGPPTFEWDFVFGTGIDQTNSNPVYIPNTSSTVALFVEDANGCRDTAFVDVTVVPVPEADFTFTPACEDIAIQLNSTSTQAGSPLVNYEWIVDGVSLLNGQNVQYIHPTGNDTIEVLLLVTDANGCEDGIIYNIYVEEQPIIESLLSDFTICVGDSVFVNLNDTTQFTYSGVADFEWNPSSTAISLGNDSFALVPGLTTLYNLIGFGTNNVCPPDNNNQVLVRVLNKPTVTIDATPNPIISGTSSQITVDVIPFNGATDSLIWTNGQNSLFPLLGGNITATPLEETTYPLTLVYYIDTFKCELDTFVTISVLDICGGEIVYVPNIFTPNNDGKNDEFRITGYGLSLVNKLIVFDRWGKVMFEGNNLPMVNGKMQNGWRGDNKAGKACNSGVYVYLYEATCANGEIVKGNGNVTLIK